MIREVENRTNDMADGVPEDDLATLDIQEADREVGTANPIATETKDKEEEVVVSHASFIKELSKLSKTAAAETKDYDVEKVEKVKKVEIIGGEFGVFSTSVASTDAFEILDENEDKVINGTFNSDDIIDPTGMEEGGNNKVEMRRQREEEERENDDKKEVERCAACVILCRDEEGDIIRNIQDEGGGAGWI